MFEREIKFIYDFNLNRINKIGSYLTFELLSSLDIHPAILKYISAEIDFLIFEDRQKLLQDSVFDYSGEKINGYFNLIDSEIKKSKKLSIEYIDKLLLHAISFIVNYLVRPRWTLSRFLFDKDESKSTAEVKQIINYVYFYNYLTDTLVSFLDKKKLVSVSQNDVDELIKKIDNFTIESYLPSIIETAVNSMSEFFNIGTVQQNKVSINAVKLFLQEKNLDDHIKKLEDTFSQDERIKYSTADLLNALSSGELMFNLKSMETEQIDEDEIENKESLEFEPVEEEPIPDESSSLNESLPDDYEEIKSDNENTDSYDDENNSEYESADVETEESKTLESVSPNLETELSMSDNEINEQPISENEMIEETESDINEVSNESENLNKIEEDEDLEPEEVSSDVEMISPDEKFAFEEIEEEKESEIEAKIELPINTDKEPTLDKDESEEITEENFDYQTMLENKGIVEQFKNGIVETETPEIEISESSGTEIEELDDEENLQSAENDIPFDENSEVEREVEGITTEGKSESVSGEYLEEAAEQEIKEIGTESITDEITESENYEFEEAGTESDENETKEIPNEESSIINDATDLSGEYTAPEEEETKEEDQSEKISEIIGEMESDVFVEDENDVEENILEEDNEDAEQDIVEVEQPELFPPEELDSDNSEDLKLNNSDEEVKEVVANVEEAAPSPQIELSELLGNKNMNKILKVVFDYDMDDFVSAIDAIAECKNEDEATSILEKIYNSNGVKPTSKEAKAFNSIITEYFKKA